MMSWLKQSSNAAQRPVVDDKKGDSSSVLFPPPERTSLNRWNVASNSKVYNFKRVMLSRPSLHQPCSILIPEHIFSIIIKKAAIGQHRNLSVTAHTERATRYLHSHPPTRFYTISISDGTKGSLLPAGYTIPALSEVMMLHSQSIHNITSFFSSQPHQPATTAS